MKVLGIDPGATTGWCLYDTEARRVLACGEFRSDAGPGPIQDVIAENQDDIDYIDYVVIESMREPRGNIYPQTVVSAIYEGELTQAVRHLGYHFYCLSRHDVKLRLTAATQRTVVVTDDKTVWQALVLLHGKGSDRKPRRKKGVVVEAGGALSDVAGHARAALAVAVAWTLRTAEPAKEAT